MTPITSDYRPARRLVPIFSPMDTLCPLQTSLSLAKVLASRGESVLLLDIRDGDLMTHAGIVYARTLGDVLYRGAQIRDAKYITSNEHFTAAAAGDATLEALLGSIAALSLSYDWTLVCAPGGCTPAHVNLAAAASGSVMLYGTGGDDFMRSYWMIDAVRSRQPAFDPVLLASGETNAESGDMLAHTIKEFLGGSPTLSGHINDPDMAHVLAAKISAAATASPILAQVK